MRRKILLGIAMFAALLTSCSDKQEPTGTGDEAASYTSGNRPIFYGKTDTNVAHNAVVILAAQNSGFCTGTLISEDYVITAAHCLADLSSSEKKSLVIGIGKDEPTALKRTYSVEKYWYHEKYSGYDVKNDIGLLKLAKAVPESVAKPILPLPPELVITQKDINKGILTEFSGYGYDETWTYGTKLQLELPVQHYCGAYNSPADSTSGCYISSLRDTIPYGSIYYTQGDGGPCSGDSGGPAFITIDGIEYVWGLTSYGDSYCKIYGVSTSVPDFYDWILSKGYKAPVEESPNIIEDPIEDPIVDPIEDPILSTYEVCDDGLDNDDNGFVDCEDYACESDEACVTVPNLGCAESFFTEYCSGTSMVQCIDGQIKTTDCAILGGTCTSKYNEYWHIEAFCVYEPTAPIIIEPEEIIHGYVDVGGKPGDYCTSGEYVPTCIEGGANALICSRGVVKQWDCKDSICSYNPDTNRVNCAKP